MPRKSRVQLRQTSSISISEPVRRWLGYLWAGSYAWVSEAAEPFAAVYIIETECIASFGYFVSRRWQLYRFRNRASVPREVTQVQHGDLRKMCQYSFYAKTAISHLDGSI